MDLGETTFAFVAALTSNRYHVIFHGFTCYFEVWSLLSGVFLVASARLSRVFWTGLGGWVSVGEYLFLLWDSCCLPMSSYNDMVFVLDALPVGRVVKPRTL